MTLPRDILDELRAIRIAKNIYQEDLACLAGYNRHQIIRGEARQVAPRLSTVCNWAEALGYDLVLKRKDEK